MNNIKIKLDVTTTLRAPEVGRIVTHFRGLGKRILYRELMGFSPAEVAGTASAKKYNLTAEDIAKAAGRTEE